MRLKELSQVNELDSAISELHQKLNTLYQQRQRLLQSDTPVHTAVANDLETLRAIWQQYDITLPTTTPFIRKYNKALELSRNNTGLSVVVVPPSGMLEAAVRGIPRYDCINTELYRDVKSSKKWSVLAVSRHSSAASINDLQAFLQSNMYDTAYCGLGIQEVIAADLQGVQTVQAGSWTVLLKDTRSATPLCVTTDNSRLILDLEDTNCLLGTNIFQPAQAIK